MLLCSAMLGLACSSPRNPQANPPEATTVPADRESAAGGGLTPVAHGTAEVESEQADERPGTEDVPAPSGSRRPIAQTGGHSGVYDDTGDLNSEGEPPRWVDLTRVVARSAGSTLIFRLSMAAAVPSSTGDGETFASLGVRLELPGGDETHVYLDGNSAGWAGYFSRGERTQKLKGYEISGALIELRLPREEIGDPRRFAWSAYSSWTRSTLLTVHYGFDSAPEGGTIRHRVPR